jgi:ribosomal protein S18 acetylase RimI-like enzyme
MFKNLKENACFDNTDLYNFVRYSLKRMTDEDIGEYLLKIRKRDDYFIHGYYDNGKLAGLIIYKIIDTKGMVEVISVEKGDRRKKIGTQLFNEVYRLHRNITIEAICGTDSVGFYKALGFEIQSLGKNYYEEESFRCTIKSKED